MSWDLRLGDCLDPVTGLALLAEGSVDLVVTDPPYGVSNEGMWHYGRPGKGKRQFDFFDGAADFGGMLEVVMAAASATLRLMSEKASAYWYCGHREFGPLVSLFEARGFKTRFLVWAKSAPSPAPPGSGWPSAAELCVYAFRPGRTWTHGGSNPPPSNVLWVDSYRHGQPGKVDHPTQKPEAVIEPLVWASSLRGEMVLDPFAGSGTTGVACIRNGRNFIGWEREPRYYEIARKRLEAAREQPDLFRERQAPVRQLALPTEAS